MRQISLPKLSGLAVLASLALAAPAAASGGYFCEGDDVALDMATGRLPVLQVIGAYAEAGGKAYSTGPERGEGMPFVVGQAFADDDGVKVDFVDPNFEAILVSLRLRFDGDEDWPLTGTLTLDGTDYPVRCGGD
ncbi:hypothetical protein [Devosia sp.]|uniref:hypothetical protein n=1 Tax=Devosia sp. TaxID=1871048 RepID=UPI002FCAE799